ncbi:serine hydrolase domain-containing protein [Chondrinema litorale]|uniref:serine hydrolase domain-containing protein n=1 Tax=Chondrinema litorale TaxID=2994555 RepID=UPI0025436D9E|nr:serine hydrolase domain-containing protein [Chondrinema litorale]UZR93370.1 serine hydrolase [Chondrinema litorale]
MRNYITKHTLRLLVVFALFFHTQLFAQLVVETPAENVGISTDRLQRIDGLINQYIADNKIPGAIALVAREGKIVYHKAIGKKHIEKNINLKTSDIFRLASMTKCITSVALMMLYEEGKFLLDDPVSQYIPEFKNAKVAIFSNDSTYEVVPANTPVTIRHLLSHTSGIGYGAFSPRAAVLYNPKQIPDAFVTADIKIGEKMKLLAQQPLLHHPGEKWTYGLSTDMVGYLVEVLSGKSLSDFMDEKILKPLGMSDTQFYLPDSKKERLVPVYGAIEDNKLTINNNETEFQSFNFPIKGAKAYFSGGSGLTSTAEDYFKFAQMLLNGGIYNNQRILSPLTIELMTSNQIGSLSTSPGNPNFFGLGFSVISKKGAAESLASEGRYNWSGFFNTVYWVDPKEEIVAVLLTQIVPSKSYGLFEKFQNVVNQAVIE